MSDSTSSENSEQRAITDRKVDLYFPRPIDNNEVPQITQKGFKPITMEEEANLLKQGTMTYYRGHLESGCCEACDDALRTSDKFARSGGELRPVEVQRHKYIDKRKTDCVMYKRGMNVPNVIGTGFNQVKDDKFERLAHLHDKWIKQNYQGELYNALTNSFQILGSATFEEHPTDEIFTLMYLILENDLPELFFDPTEYIKENMGAFREYVLYTIERIRIILLEPVFFQLSSNFFAMFSTIVLVMLTEFSSRRGVQGHFIQFLISLTSTIPHLSFATMVKQLGKLPVFNERKRGATKVQFNDPDNSDSTGGEEFKIKRKKFDKCPLEVTGRQMEE